MQYAQVNGHPLQQSAQNGPSAIHEPFIIFFRENDTIKGWN